MGNENNTNEMNDIWSELLSEFASTFTDNGIEAPFWNDIVPSSAEYPYILLDGESDLAQWMTLGHVTAGESGTMIFHVVNSREKGGGRVCRQITHKLIKALHLNTLEVNEAEVKDIRRRRISKPFPLGTDEDLVAQTTTFSMNLQYKEDSDYFNN